MRYYKCLECRFNYLESGWKCKSVNLFKMTLSALGWTPAETYYPLEGEILFSQLTEGNWKKTWTKDELTMICALLVVQSTDELPIVTCNEEQLLPPESANIKDAVFVLVKSEDSNYSLLKVIYNNLFITPRFINSGSCRLLIGLRLLCYKDPGIHSCWRF